LFEFAGFTSPNYTSTTVSLHKPRIIASLGAKTAMR
jgi:hypothetical protein